MDRRDSDLDVTEAAAVILVVLMVIILAWNCLFRLDSSQFEQAREAGRRSVVEARM